MAKFLTTDEVISRGWTRGMVRRLLRPDKIEQYSANGWDVTRHRYSLRRVSAAERSKAFRLAKERCERTRNSQTPDGVQRRQREQNARFERKYATVDAALPDACEAMFNLNRYAKHRSCTAAHRDEIYLLKNGLVRLLYAQGFCTGSKEHNVPGKRCYRCNGTGEGGNDWPDDWHGADDDAVDECNRCGGSGWYIDPSVLVSFRFGLVGRNYCWHMPADCVSFAYVTTGEASMWQPDAEEKPVSLSPSSFARAKALIRWALDRKEKMVSFKERVARNLAHEPPIHRQHGQSLEEKLEKLGHPSPDEAADEIRRGSQRAPEVIRNLREERVEAFKRRIAAQLDYKPPVHKVHGWSLQQKLFAALPKGTPFRNRTAAITCAKVRAAELTFQQALALLRNETSEQNQCP